MSTKRRVCVLAACVATTLSSLASDSAGAPPPLCKGRLATIVGTPGNDTLTGTKGRDVIKGLAQNDTLCGGDGYDVIEGNGGNDVIDGGADGGAASYAAAPGAVTASLATGTSSGADGADTLVNIGELDLGSRTWHSHGRT